MRDRVRALAVLIAVFLVGGIIGASVIYRLFEKPMQYPAREERNGSSVRIEDHQRLPDFLELTKKQEAQFREIMAESWKQLDTLRNEQTPKIHAIQAETNRMLMQILNPEQQKKFTAFLEEMKNRRERPPRRRGTAPPQ